MRFTPITFNTLVNPLRYNPGTRSINWFPGHMAKGIREIETRLKQIDVILEIRDCRIPLSSINPRFEQMIKNERMRNRDGSNDIQRVIVYNKRDLIEDKEVKLIKYGFKKYTSDKLLFTDKNENQTVERLLNVIKGDIKNQPLRYPFLNVMVVGMPNVGKSSIINSLRRVGVNKGKALTTGGQPGITRNISSSIKVADNPAIYLYDTPGVMIPHIPDPLISLKVALSGGIHDHLADEIILSDYLLWELNQRNERNYHQLYLKNNDNNIENNDNNNINNIDDINELLTKIAHKAGILNKGGVVNLNEAAKYFLKRYRLGKLGKFVLDDITELGFQHYFNYLNAVNDMNFKNKKIHVINKKDLSNSNNYENESVVDSSRGNEKNMRDNNKDKLKNKENMDINNTNNIYNINPNYQIIPSKQLKLKMKKQIRLDKINKKKAMMPGLKF